MALLYGFKAGANRVAVGLRRQMGLSASSPINLHTLLEKLGIAAAPLTAFEAQCPGQVAELNTVGGGGFSALLLSTGDGGRMILYNDTHGIGRQNSNLAHEISHALLAHSPEIVSGCSSCRDFDQDVENEASFLAGCILVPNDAAWLIARSKMDLDLAQERYGVSRRMLDYRLNVSGARRRLARLRAG